jgi:hypothetical protein
MSGDLTTTNILLGILTTISVLEALLVIGLFAGGAFALRRMLHTLAQIEERRIAPATERVTKILDDVQAITEVGRRAAQGADRVAGWWRTVRGA